ncbi:hypothetical protein C8J57DRAFT_50938 [Mycena rebaudengoi]|nr:hypothetical protein C8J57DRAFT_50938 [Mycena rebaudengoi]
MLHFNEFSAWITIDGVDAPEYNVEVSHASNTVTCWIASELGKTFTVNWRNGSYYANDVAGYIRADGSFCGGSICRAASVPSTIVKRGVEDGVVLRPFTFSSLTLTDDDAFLGESSAHQDLGVIELSLTPIEVLHDTVLAKNHDLAVVKVHERAKKAVTQQITLGAPEYTGIAKQNTKTVRRKGPDLAKMTFKYRSLDILRANGIAPLPDKLKRKASVPLERNSTPDDDDGDAEEARNLRDKLKALEAKQTKKNGKKPVKREQNVGSDIIDLTQGASGSKRVKLERVPAPFVAGEIIDLT